MRLTGGLHGRRRLGVLALTVVIAAALVAIAPPALGGGHMFITVEKTVFGTAAGGTVFTVSYSCDNGGPSGTVTFDADGDEITGSPVDALPAGGGAPPRTCTFTEDPPNNGSADNTAFSCTDNGNSNATCGSGGNRVTWNVNNGANPTITVYNAYSNYFDPPTATSAAPGEQATVSGSKCTKELFGGAATTGGNVSVTVDFPTPIVLNTTAAGTTGNWSVTFTVPAGATGSYTVSAVCDDPVPYPDLTFTVATAGSGSTATPAVVATPATTG